MIAAFERARALDRVDIFRFGDDANDRTIAPIVGAELARIQFGERKARRTETHLVFDGKDGFGKRVRFVTRTIQQMKNELKCLQVIVSTDIVPKSADIGFRVLQIVVDLFTAR